LISAEGEITEKIRDHKIYKTGFFLISVLGVWGSCRKAALPPVAAPLNENTGFIMCLEQAKRKENFTFSLDV
jgi:hypothetical protein